MWIVWSALASAGVDRPYETVWGQTRHGTMAFWDEGQGEPIVLVHGLPTSKELWVDVIPELQGHRVIAVDLVDFGESRETTADLRHPQRAEALDDLLEGLGLDQVVLVAHDLGSSVAVDYMGAFGDRVSDLVLMSSPVYPDFDEPEVVELVRRPAMGVLLTNLLPRTMYRMTLNMGLVHDDAVDRLQVGSFIEAYRCPPGKQRLLDNLWWGTPEDMFAAYPDILRALPHRSLVLHGAQDPFIPLAHAHRLDSDLADSQLVVIEDGAHFLPLDTPVRVASEILAFLGD